MCSFQKLTRWDISDASLNMHFVRTICTKENIGARLVLITKQPTSSLFANGEGHLYWGIGITKIILVLWHVQISETNNKSLEDCNFVQVDTYFYYINFVKHDVPL